MAAGFSYAATSFVSARNRRFTANELSCLGCLLPVRPDIADVGHDSSHLAVIVWVGWLPRVQAIYVTVKHAEGSRDQNGIVNFLIGGTLPTRPPDILWRNLLASFLNLARDREQRL